MNKKIWAFLIHLGTNCWLQKGAVADFPRPEEGFLFRDEMFCDKQTWRKVVDFLPSRGINTLLIDVADGVCYDRHPEISIPGAWTKAELRAELDRLRSMGITPIPKCNFSSGHNAWMKEYAFMIGTPKHYEVCKDVIEELIELFDTPPFFHLGLEEEEYEAIKGYPIAIIRAPWKKTEDAKFLFDVCRAHGVRPWIWAGDRDVMGFGGDEAFRKNVGTDVLLSNYFYHQIRCNDDAVNRYPFAEYCVKFAEWGYEQVPTGSTWTWHANNKDVMRFCKNYVDDKSLAGFMTASWLMTIEKKYYALLADAENFAYARRDIYGDF